ncbi:MAG: ABC transporter permease [Chloroflexota bacterium]|nr:ABC transporter permease [Chloroflexota bacterium]
MTTVQSATTVLPDAAQRPPHRIWPLVASVALALHGAIHLMGFVVDWRLAQLQTLPYRTTALGDHLDLGTAGIRSVGLLWLLAALGFIAVGVGLVRQGRPWRVPIAAVAILSLILCILTWPDSASGAVIDVAILAALLVGRGMVARQIARQGKGRNP